MSNSTDINTALDYFCFDALDKYAELGFSYWTSVKEVPLRCERLTGEVHCQQVATVTSEALGIVRILGAASDKARCSA